MNRDDLERFAEDLKHHAGLGIGLVLDPSPNGLHVLTINGADFFFNADGSGYDGWRKNLSGENLDCRSGEGSNQASMNSCTPVPRKERGKDGK